MTKRAEIPLDYLVQELAEPVQDLFTAIPLCGRAH